MYENYYVLLEVTQSTWKKYRLKRYLKMPHTLLKLEKTHSSKIYKLNIIKNNHFILVFYITKIYKMPGPDKSHVHINPFTHVVWTINGEILNTRQAWLMMNIHMIMEQNSSKLWVSTLTHSHIRIREVLLCPCAASQLLC